MRSRLLNRTRNRLRATHSLGPVGRVRLRILEHSPGLTRIHFHQCVFNIRLACLNHIGQPLPQRCRSRLPVGAFAHGCEW
ncbi:hypothetical protein KOW79_003252 [Hemibagrus wyckioides]|uniref:Uncharacterized protein n=1 Tax=Hemibagrus wyckioides TaxID=337641 RepID=A0A9D3P2C5_9TELE|nr:hypothetical protein KOW79_003252 [Hemibagrus wyckioides]